MSEYPFLVLCAVTFIPGLLAFAFRPDLRIHITRVAAMALPFAFTEFMFYPHYWNPPFLFNAAHKFGFGVEDFIFVSALGALAIGAYPAVTGRSLHQTKPGTFKSGLIKMLTVTCCALASALILWISGIPAVIAATLSMTAMAGAVFIFRKDLFRHAFYSGAVSLIAYTAVCFVFEMILPGSFDRYWHTDKLLNLFAGPVPAEELLYGFAAGFAAAAVYPFAFCLRFEHHSL